MQKFTFFSLLLLFLFSSCGKEVQLDELSSQIQNDPLAKEYFSAIKNTGKLLNLVNYPKYKELLGKSNYCDTNLETFEGDHKMFELSKSMCNSSNLGKEFKLKYPITRQLSKAQKKEVYAPFLKYEPISKEELEERAKVLDAYYSFTNGNH